MPDSPKQSESKWHHPSEVMKLHLLKKRKRALQSRITGKPASETTTNTNTSLEEIILAKKRTNPFVVQNESKKGRLELPSPIEESADQTLFKLLNESSTCASTTDTSLTSFENILNKNNDASEVLVVKAQGEKNIPVDWSLKTKIRLWSGQPFSWSQKLKIGEEASGTTGFVRCLGTGTKTNLDISPNAKFHQCCLYWQQPSLPWVKLFPRTTAKVANTTTSITTNPAVKASLQEAWKLSLKSLFHLIRTKQCPYFYICSNSFTVLFRAAGIGGIADVHALISPTTRGLRHSLKQEDIEFTMPLKNKGSSDQGYETQDSPPNEEEPPDEQWMESMGINADDIKQINYNQAKISHKLECEVDNSEESLVLVEGVEVHALYNLLINCKSATASTGPFAGIPPTLLAPVAFNGATLNALKVRESKIHVDDADFHSLELSGPILPSTIHNLFAINSREHSVSASGVSVPSTVPFSKVQSVEDGAKRNIIFDKENLSDCGLDSEVLEQFCRSDNCISNIECVKYNAENETYTWT